MGVYCHNVTLLATLSLILLTLHFRFETFVFLSHFPYHIAVTLILPELSILILLYIYRIQPFYHVNLNNLIKIQVK